MSFMAMTVLKAINIGSCWQTPCGLETGGFMHTRSLIVLAAGAVQRTSQPDTSCGSARLMLIDEPNLRSPLSSCRHI